MSMLFDRILKTGRDQTTSTYVPNRTVTSPEPPVEDVSGMPYPGGKNYNDVKQTPLTRIGIYDGFVSYESEQPLLDPSGLIIPERPVGHWAQLYRAGRLYG